MYHIKPYFYDLVKHFSRNIYFVFIRRVLLNPSTVIQMSNLVKMVTLKEQALPQDLFFLISLNCSFKVQKRGLSRKRFINTKEMSREKILGVTG
jgi:hypothetical protein